MRPNNFKIVVILSNKGVESVTVNSLDTLARKTAYEICQELERPLEILTEVVERESKKRIGIGGISNE